MEPVDKHIFTEKLPSWKDLQGKYAKCLSCTNKSTLTQFFPSTEKKKKKEMTQIFCVATKSWKNKALCVCVEDNSHSWTQMPKSYTTY